MPNSLAVWVDRSAVPQPPLAARHRNKFRCYPIPVDDIMASRVALLKARELGYPVERMAKIASVAEGLCSVHFAPLPDPVTITIRGDLSLTSASR